MTAVRVVSPRKRLDRVEFSGKREWQNHAIEVGEYTCPHCGHRVRLRTSDFARHEFDPSANAREPWQALFDAVRPDRRDAWESHLDFHCPGCNAPVRLVYEPGEEYAMGVHSWQVGAILEAARWPTDDSSGQG